MPELEPRIFSFNSPHGACPRCTGLGSQMEIDPDLIVPDPTLSIGEGAIVPWASSASNYYEQLMQCIAERYDVDLETPWEDLAQDARGFFLYGTNGERIQISYRNRFGRRRNYATKFEGIVANLERRYRETDSDWSREKIEEYMTLRPCPDCGGARLRPESRAVLVHGMAIHEFCNLVRPARAGVDRRPRALRARPADRPADPARDRRAAALPRQRRRRLPVDGARGGDAVGRRGAADPAGHADRVLARRRPLHPRRAVDRPAPARQRAADRHARAPARPRQHRARRRARRGHDARGRPRRRHRPGRGRARRPRRGRGHGRGDHQGPRVADRPVPLRRAPHRGARSSAASRPGYVDDRGREPAQPQGRRREGPARAF